MFAWQFVRRSAVFHWRLHAAVALSVCVAAAALAGALLVGDSLRGSLRDAALRRIGPFDAALIAARPFDDTLGDRIGLPDGARAIPAILVQGAATHAQSGARAAGVQAIGLRRAPEALAADDAGVTINDRLATELGAAIGDDIVLHLPRVGVVSAETLLGRRDEAPASLRVTVAAIEPADGLAGFALRPQQTPPMNVYLPLERAARLVGVAGRANALLISRPGHAGPIDLRQGATPADHGLRCRIDPARGYIALESEAMTLPIAVERAALAVADAMDLSAVPLMVYLANEIAAGGESLAYSVVAAVDQRELAHAGAPAQIAPGGIIVTQFTADALRATINDPIELSYFAAGRAGTLDTRRASFRVAGVLPAENRWWDDAGFVPAYAGVTDSRSMSDWNAPFPIDQRRITPRDEQYWERHRTAPKAFVALDDARRLWGDDDRFGSLSSIRLRPKFTADEGSLAAVADAFSHRLMGQLDPASLGWRVEPLRERAIAASNGPTDFAGLFLGFSFFIIGSAAMLVALLFRVGVERRAADIGTLLAIGVTPRTVARLLLLEGMIVAVAGAVAGAPLGALYAGAMLAGLRGWWSAAVGAPFLELHVSTGSLAIGAGASVLIAVASIALALRGLANRPPRELLNGPLAGDAPTTQRRGWIAPAMTAAIALAVALAAIAGFLPLTLGFFVVGVGVLTTLLLVWRRWLDAADVARRALSLGSLAFRSAARNRTRSVLVASLIASASFLVAAVGAFRAEPVDLERRDSGSGGYALLAESSTPLLHDLATPQGRAQLDLADLEAEFREVQIVPLRLRNGDAAGCTNLYARGEPRILGATKRFLDRGGFAFHSALPHDESAWRLLESPIIDAIPCIADEAAVHWQFHSKLGGEIEIHDDAGQPRRLRFVALLAGSALQDEVIIAEADFERLFPSISGYALFLIDAPRQRRDEFAASIERALGGFGLDVVSVRARIESYLAVQNTYLSTFLMLGGIGLALGALGTAAVALRNVQERRRELALLRAVGVGDRRVGRLIFLESLLLTASGLACGLTAAVAAIAPAAWSRPAAVPWAGVAGLLTAVLLASACGTLLALRGFFRSPLMPELRSA